MSQIQNTNSTSTTDQTFGSANTLNDLNMDDFLQLMIAELQNQDPLNPLENDELIAQISQIREVGATEQLTETLNAVLLGQNISSATNLIGADVEALNDEGQRVTGNVRSVSIVDGEPKLELAVETAPTAGSAEGDLEDGAYTYAVVWETEGGDLLGMQIDTTYTDSLEDFTGSIQIDNLPETTGEKKVYRTDSTGAGDLKLLAVIPNGSTTTFVDRYSDEALNDDTLPEGVTAVEYADSVTVTLSNVGEVRPPEE